MLASVNPGGQCRFTAVSSRKHDTFTHMGVGETPLGANDDIAGVSEQLFDFSDSRDGEQPANSKQQFRVGHRRQGPWGRGLLQPRPCSQARIYKYSRFQLMLFIIGSR